jgi:hypothetical protein
MYLKRIIKLREAPPFRRGASLNRSSPEKVLSKQDYAIEISREIKTDALDNVPM